MGAVGAIAGIAGKAIGGSGILKGLGGILGKGGNKEGGGGLPNPMELLSKLIGFGKG